MRYNMNIDVSNYMDSENRRVPCNALQRDASLFFFLLHNRKSFRTPFAHWMKHETGMAYATTLS